MANVVKKGSSSEGKDAIGEELDILHPQREALIAGRKVTVREYGFVEGTRLRLVAKPFMDSLYDLIGGKAVPTYDAVKDVMALHIDLVVELMARAADVDVAWISELNDPDGDLLALMWWGANGSFFMRAALQRLKAENEVRNLLAGGASTQPSSPTATESPTSEATPSAS